jgi:hypothetical protein
MLVNRQTFQEVETFDVGVDEEFATKEANLFPVHQAVKEGNYELVLHIIEQSGKEILNTLDDYGQTPLFCVKDDRMAVLLLTHHAKTDVVDLFDSTPFTNWINTKKDLDEGLYFRVIKIFLKFNEQLACNLQALDEESQELVQLARDVLEKEKEISHLLLMFINDKDSLFNNIPNEIKMKIGVNSYLILH